MLGFKNDVVNFLFTLCFRITEKSPIKFPLTQNSRCFIPNLLVESLAVTEMRNKHYYRKILLQLIRWRKTAVFKVSKHRKNRNYRNFLILITFQKVTNSIVFLWITSDMWNVLKNWLKYWKSSLRFRMDKPLLKETSVLTNRSLW